MDFSMFLADSDSLIQKIIFFVIAAIIWGVGAAAAAMKKAKEQQQKIHAPPPLPVAEPPHSPPPLPPSPRAMGLGWGKAQIPARPAQPRPPQKAAGAARPSQPNPRKNKRNKAAQQAKRAFVAEDVPPRGALPIEPPSPIMATAIGVGEAPSISPAAVDARAVRASLSPSLARRQWVVAELLRPPLALREHDQ